MVKSSRWPLRVGIVLVVAAATYAAWKYVQPRTLPGGFASGNGRIEAVEIDIATKTPGRIKDVLVHEGDFVRAGQDLATMDTSVLLAQRREAEAQLQGAIIGVDSAKAQVVQRTAERQAAVAVVAQREAEMDAAQKQFTRSEKLTSRSVTSEAVLDQHRAQYEGAKAAVSAAQAQVASADAAVGAAEAAVIDAEARVTAARATIERIQADIDDSTLRSPRDGRIQYRVAQPGEVLSAGGRVLNMIDLGDVYMTFFLPTEAAGRVRIGSEVRLVLDAAPEYVVPARVTFVSNVAQFTPKTVETAEERQKLMFRVKAHIDRALLRKYITDVKTGLPGMAYVQLDPKAEWPANLQSNIVQ